MKSSLLPNLSRGGPNLYLTSRFSHMRELRIQYRGNPYRVLYALDPRRTAILLIGGSKKGNSRWYQQFVPLADKLYAEHLLALQTEGET